MEAFNQDLEMQNNPVQNGLNAVPREMRSARIDGRINSAMQLHLQQNRAALATAASTSTRRTSANNEGPLEAYKRMAAVMANAAANASLADQANLINLLNQNNGRVAGRPGFQPVAKNSGENAPSMEQAFVQGMSEGGGEKADPTQQSSHNRLTDGDYTNDNNSDKSIYAPENADTGGMTGDPATANESQGAANEANGIDQPIEASSAQPQEAQSSNAQDGSTQEKPKSGLLDAQETNKGIPTVNPSKNASAEDGLDDNESANEATSTDDEQPNQNPSETDQLAELDKQRQQAREAQADDKRREQAKQESTEEIAQATVDRYKMRNGTALWMLTILKESADFLAVIPIVGSAMSYFIDVFAGGGILLIYLTQSREYLNMVVSKNIHLFIFMILGELIEYVAFIPFVGGLNVYLKRYIKKLGQKEAAKVAEKAQGQ